MDSELHNRAVSLQPEVLPLKRYWISILLHHAQEKPLTALVNDDFLWIKGAKKITVSKLKDEYVKRNNVDFDLRFGNEILQGVTTVGALDFLKDRCIVLRAVPKNEEEDPPLQQPSSSSAAHREPLQPTNRQIQVPSPTTNGPRKPSYPKGLSWKPPLPDPAAVNGRQNASWTAPLPSPASAPTHWKSSSPSRYRTASPYENLYPANLRMHPYPAATRYSGPNAYSGSNSSPLAYPAQPGDPSPVPGQEATPTPLSLAKPVAGIFQGETQDDADAMSPPEEPTPTPPPLPPQNLHLQKLLDVNGDYPVEILEDGVSRGVELLRGFQDSMKSKAELSRDATQWLTQIETLREKAVKGRTVIGVVGNTGAGKSSVINAMLDEERLVPTNCMRACTAVVTEISWNDSEDPAQLYRAQIEFIKAADWEKELSILFKDLVDSDGQVYKESSNADSDAGVAYAKIKAVYPHLTKDMIADSSVAKLMRHPAVQNVLGTTKKIVQQQCGKFYKSLQQYVDSKEKLSKEEKESQKKEKGPKKPEFWPLIRIVKIFTKAAALSTGAVIVDLPGVQDSNTARAAVAEGYMKQCTGLWIVAPITRAVDDKAAKNLLGQQFKRQLKYDGTYGNVTFICSKTDDISITEAADSLDMDEQISEAYSESQDLEAEIKRLEDDNDELLKSREKYTDILEETTTQLEQWKELEEKLDSGKNVFAPREKKRKRTKDHKRRNRDLFDSQDLDSDSDDASAIESENDDEIEELPLTAEQISSKLEALKEQKADAKREKEGIVDRRKTTRKRLQEAKAKLSNLKSEMSAVCIAGRNKYSKTAIQQDFAAGVKELDQEKASEEDEASFNPDEDLRDYDEIARSLPVFCVSSRAYQKLSGRLEKDSSVSGFTEAGQTGVPQLQDHCRKLTESGRAAGARAFLNLLSQFFNSLALWSSDTNSSRFMTTSQSEARQAFLDDQLQNLDQVCVAITDCRLMY